MALPFFYLAAYDATQKEIVLDEDTSRHVVQVLRMKEREQMNLTDGRGILLTAEITEAHKKHCTVKVIDSQFTPPVSRKITIAISLLKNTNRFEWFLEKATEIGVSEIIPLICERTEKQKFRFERMKGICVSAMLQSQQVWLPELEEPQTFDRALKNAHAILNMIAYCGDGKKHPIPHLLDNYPADSYTIFIGPEGDFTPDEIKYAGAMQCFSVTLGETRLRSETAGVVASVILTHT